MKKAYRKLAIQYFPDRAGDGNEKNKKKLKEVSEGTFFNGNYL